jgi:hypothetical protein
MSDDRAQPPAVEPLGAVTASGLPYPAATDPVSGGAAAIQALAETLDPRVGKGRTVRGAVSAAGAVVGGDGFTSVRSSTGRYIITFAPPFPSGKPPFCVATVIASTGLEALSMNQPQPGSWQVNVQSISEAASHAPLDAGFNFIAIGDVS